jgi:hypothetical protein
MRFNSAGPPNSKPRRKQASACEANIDQFADEIGTDGKPLRPHFNTVLPIILDLFKG